MRRARADLRTIEPRRVAIIKPSSLGDVVHALPVLAALRERWPGAEFTWVIASGLRGLLESHPDLAGTIPFDRRAIRFGRGGVRAAWRFAGELRRPGFDLAIDLQGLLRSGLMAAATRAPVRVGPANAREGATAFYTHRVQTPAAHAVDQLLDVARALGAEVRTPRFPLALCDEDLAWAEEALLPVPRPRLVLNVGARWVTKRWPPESFAAVARRAVMERGAGLIAVGAPEDRPPINRLVASLGPIPVCDLGGRTSLRQLAAVAARSDVFLSNDTGPLHLAAATGVRVVGVYTCTRPEWTGPYGPNAAAVTSRVWCAGSCVKRCGRMECMTELTAERVWGAVARALDGDARLRVRAEGRAVRG